MSDALAFVCSPGPVPKQRRVLEGRAPAAAIAPGIAGSSGRAGGEGSNPSEEISIGEPIVPPYNGSKALPFAQVFHENKTAGASPDVEEAGKSSDSLLEEIRASPPPFGYYHGEQLEDDPQLTVENMKKFQAVVREFTKLSLVSIIVEYFFLLWCLSVY